ncbi:MAG: HlyD family type I secretion periplasmic adaptor subunit [Methylococcaceae bacterium]|nr:HlyD family type I secretion periplasmic adaptor subunit [Methylococcaceae bacterium]
MASASNTQHEIKIKDTGLRTVGYLLLLVVFGLLGGWSYIAPLDSAVYATGDVAVKNFSKTVQHLEGGIINRIYTKDGATVKKGDVLIELDDTQIKAQQEIVRGQYFAFKAQESRLLSEQRESKTVEFSTEIKNEIDPRITDMINGQVNIFETRKKSKNGETKVLRQRIEQLNSKLLGLKLQNESKHTLSNLYGDEISELILLVDEGFADKQRLRDLQRKQAETQANIAALVSEQATIKIQAGETEIQILQLNTKKQEEVAFELGQVQTQLFDLWEKRVALDDRVKRTKIRATVSGYVLGLTTHTEGGIIEPSKPILQIVPEKGDLIISAQVSPTDIDRVQMGMQAEIRFSSFKQGVTPKLTGTVILLSADSLVNEQTGLAYYEVRLELSEKSQQDLLGLKLVPGMPAEVLIATGERTLWQYLVQPFTDAYARAMIED